MLNVNFEAMRKEINNILEKLEDNEISYGEAANELLNLHNVSNSLPTKDEVIAEGNKQIQDWLSENHHKEQSAYRVAFRRSYEYVLRFIK